MTVFDAVILAGGSGSRLGGADKPSIILGSSTLLDRALEAACTAAAVVVVGPERHLGLPAVLSAMEAPPGSGPVAAIAAGLACIREHRQAAELTVVSASDLPNAVAAVRELLASIDRKPEADVEGWVGVDPKDRMQYLLAVYNTQALTAACSTLAAERGTLTGAPVWQLLRPLRLAGVALTAEHAADIDTEADLVAAREREGSRHGVSV